MSSANYLFCSAARKVIIRHDARELNNFTNACNLARKVEKEERINSLAEHLLISPRTLEGEDFLCRTHCYIPKEILLRGYFCETHQFPSMRRPHASHGLPVGCFIATFHAFYKKQFFAD